MGSGCGLAGGVLVWRWRWRFRRCALSSLALAPSLWLSLLLLPPSSLLLAETGLDQASNLAHARMDEAKLCRDCVV